MDVTHLVRELIVGVVTVVITFLSQGDPKVSILKLFNGPKQLLPLHFAGKSF